MTNSKDLEQRMEAIGRVQLRGAALGWGGRQTYEKYKNLLPPEVVLIDFPSKCLNCAGYALDINHSTSNPEEYLNSDYDEVDNPRNANIYIMYFHGEWVHIGRVVDEETAISKWGWFEPVFRHPLLFYSGSWDDIKYFRRKDL